VAWPKEVTSFARLGGNFVAEAGRKSYENIVWIIVLHI
jgi:hypothetical protein